MNDTATIEPKSEWAVTRRWRELRRKELLSRRMALPLAARRAARRAVIAALEPLLDAGGRGPVGLYWPFKGELDMRHVADCGRRAALPVVVEPAWPLAFWTWRHGMALQRGVWDIPIPADCDPVRPTLLLVPLLGFDGHGFRLGYGGGYYDRTLAAMTPRPIAIGIGYEIGCLPTIHPQPHDIPMDAIVTESGVRLIGRRLNPMKQR